MKRNSAFTHQVRFDGDVWMHANGRVWIVKYEETPYRRAFYQAYRAVQEVPEGRKPWSVDNRRIGNADYGFPTLDEAMTAAAEAAEKVTA
jgi:hypothetical protein